MIYKILEICFEDIKNLHNQLATDGTINTKLIITSDINIFARIKPKEYIKNTVYEQLNNDNTHLKINTPTVNNNKYQLHYLVDNIFTGTIDELSNQEIAKQMDVITIGLNNGESQLIIPYGGSGSGKTSTLFKLKTTNINQQGIIPEILSQVDIKYTKLSLDIKEIIPNFDNFDNLIKSPKISNIFSKTNILNFTRIDNKPWITDSPYTIQIEPKFDLLYIKTTNDIFTRYTNTITIPQNTELSDILVFFITEFRAISRTIQNIESSRSHIICDFTLKQNDDNGIKFIVCDLAGKEFILDFENIFTYTSLLKVREGKDETKWTFNKLKEYVEFFNTQKGATLISNIVQNIYDDNDKKNYFVNLLLLFANKLGYIENNINKIYDTLYSDFINYESDNFETNLNNFYTEINNTDIHDIYEYINNIKNITKITDPNKPTEITDEQKQNLIISTKTLLNELFNIKYNNNNSIETLIKSNHYFNLLFNNPQDKKLKLATAFTYKDMKLNQENIPKSIQEIITEFNDSILERFNINNVDIDIDIDNNNNDTKTFLETLQKKLKEPSNVKINIESNELINEINNIIKTNYTDELEKLTTKYTTELDTYNEQELINKTNKEKEYLETNIPIYNCFALLIVIIFTAFNGKFINNYLEDISKYITLSGVNQPLYQGCNYEYYLANEGMLHKSLTITEYTDQKNELFKKIFELDDLTLKLTLLFTMKPEHEENEDTYFLPYVFIENSKYTIHPNIIRLLIDYFEKLIKLNNNTDKNNINNIITTNILLFQYNYHLKNFKIDDITNNNDNLLKSIINIIEMYFSTLKSILLVYGNLNKNFILTLTNKIESYMNMFKTDFYENNENNENDKVENYSTNLPIENISTNFNRIIDYINNYNAQTLIGTTQILEVLQDSRSISCVKEEKNELTLDNIYDTINENITNLTENHNKLLNDFDVDKYIELQHLK